MRGQKSAFLGCTSCHVVLHCTTCHVLQPGIWRLLMGRDRRITVFVNDQEYGILRAVSPDDEALGRTVRRLAMERAEWMAEHGRKQRGRASPVRDDGPYNDGPVLDRSYSQE